MLDSLILFFSHCRELNPESHVNLTRALPLSILLLFFFSFFFFLIFETSSLLSCLGRPYTWNPPASDSWNNCPTLSCLSVCLIFLDQTYRRKKCLLSQSKFIFSENDMRKEHRWTASLVSQWVYSSLGWPGTHYVGQAVLELIRDPAVSDSQMLGD